MIFSSKLALRSNVSRMKVLSREDSGSAPWKSIAHRASDCCVASGWFLDTFRLSSKKIACHQSLLIVSCFQMKMRSLLMNDHRYYIFDTERLL